MVMMTSDYIIIVIVELTLKTSYRTYPYCVKVMMTLDYIIIVKVELTLENSCRNIHIFKKLPNMVSLITKPKLWLNSHQKTGPGGI